jgi:hypothetical protein
MFTLHRRPFYGFAAAINFPRASSGCVPDVGGEGRCGNPTGGDEGPNHGFYLFSRVFYANVEDWFVKDAPCKVLLVICTPPLSNKAAI